MKRCGCAGAGILSVNDGNTADAHLAEHDLATNAFLTGDETGHRIADSDRFERVLIHT